MSSAIPFSPPHISLCGLLAETCMLQRYMIEALELQQLEPRLQANPQAYGLVGEALKILQQNVAQAMELLEPLRHSTHEMQEANARLAGMFVGSLSKRRPREVPMILRDNYTLLQFAIMNYTMLRAHSEAMGETDAATLATSHLRFLSAIVESILQQMPAIVAQERRRGHGDAAKPSNTSSAHAKNAWQNSTSAA